MTRDQDPKEEEMKAMSEFVTKLEGYADLEVSIIRATKINKVLKAILKLNVIPKEEEFQFKPRSQTLLDKWNKLLASEQGTPLPTLAATNGTNGEAKTDAEGAKASPSDGSNGIKAASSQKLVFHLGQEVAFQRKFPGKPSDFEWIRGEVTSIIGEGKSRRYQIKDLFPEDQGDELYKSSASRMIPIPPEGTLLQDYKPLTIVLAQYPESSTFYRATVKATLDGGSKVQLLFEDDEYNRLQIVERRMVLDYKSKKTSDSLI